MSDTPENTLLLVDPDHDYLDWATKHLAADGLKILRCDSADKALKVIDKISVDLVISDIKLDPFDGVELLSKIRAHSPDTIVMLTAVSPSTIQIIEATQKGAHDVLRKESVGFELRKIVESGLQTIDQRRELGPSSRELPGLVGKTSIVGISRPLQDVMKIVGRVARSDAPVLVSGESGTGKELIAERLHHLSPRWGEPLITMNLTSAPLHKCILTLVTVFDITPTHLLTVLAV